MSTEITAGVPAAGNLIPPDVGPPGGRTVRAAPIRADRAAFAGIVAEAAATAERAAHAAGVTVVELAGIVQMAQACELLDRVWRPEPGNPLITPKLMKVLSHCGSYVVGVMREGDMVGACVGFLADVGLHSHIAGVDDGLRGRSLGYAVKLHQRAWSLARGIGTVTWTFDPLISRNAYFNMAKLGAVPQEYLPDFYGAMPDAVNAGTETDRLLVRWELASERVVRALTEHSVVPALDDGLVALAAGPDGRPVLGRRDAERLLVGIPRDVEELRRVSPDLARQWRSALREALGESMQEGGTVTGFTRDGWYVVEQNPEPGWESKP